MTPPWHTKGKLLLNWQRACSGALHTARLSSILLSNPFPSATKGGPVRNTGKVTPSPRRHVAHLYFFRFYFSTCPLKMLLSVMVFLCFSLVLYCCFTVPPVVIFGTLVCRILKYPFFKKAWEPVNTHCLYWFSSHSAVQQLNHIIVWFISCKSVLNHYSAGRKSLSILAKTP